MNTNVSDMKQPWRGFWQVINDDAGVDIEPFNRTTLAVRPSAGYTIYSAHYFMEIRTLGKRPVPKSGWIPSDEEMIEAFPLVYSIGGRCSWRKSNEGWTGKHEIRLAHDPGIERNSFSRRFEVKGNREAFVQSNRDLEPREESWRQLSGPGTTPLSGAWKTESDFEDWLMIATSAHYGVMRAGKNRPKLLGDGESIEKEETLALCKQFGSNFGARIETSETFENWPFTGNVMGYETRKHETFRISDVSINQFTLSIPPLEFSVQWERLDE